MIRKIFWSILQKKPAHLILHVTNRCQLKCKTCFADDAQTTDLDIKSIQNVSDYINKPVWLEISGGEPFLRNDLPQICTQFDAKLVSISTNGQHPKRIFKIAKNIRKKLKKSIVLNIAVSIDGFPKTNDYIRGRNSFSNAISTLNRLKKIPDVKVKVNTVLCEKNYGEIIEFMKFIKTFNPDFHSVIFLRGNPRDPKFKLPALKELIKIKEDVFKIWVSYDYGIKNSIHRSILQKYQRRLFETSLKIIERKKQIPKCLAGTKHLVIHSDGGVSFCEMLSKIGDIKNEDIKKVLKSKKALDQRKKIKNGDCFCYHNCNMLDNFFLNPFQYYKLLI